MDDRHFKGAVFLPRLLGSMIKYPKDWIDCQDFTETFLKCSRLISMIMWTSIHMMHGLRLYHRLTTNLSPAELFSSIETMDTYYVHYFVPCTYLLIIRLTQKIMNHFQSSEEKLNVSLSIASVFTSTVTVLLVKSGDESQLSSPISFLPLFDAGLALDVNREDYKDGVEPTVARVALDVAIRFIWELLMKEEAAAQEAAKVAERLREEQSAFCEAWVSKVIAHSQEIGIDANGYSWLAIRRALARKNGEAFDDDQVNPMWEWLRHWTA
ncbi:hypothetical protein ACHAPJ_010248 [Fusarium lateritium]